MTDPIQYAHIAASELGADLAATTLRREPNDHEYNLPGVDIVLLAGVAIASSFFTGVALGIAKELKSWGESTGSAMVGRFRSLLSRIHASDAESQASPEDESIRAEYEELVYVLVVEMRMTQTIEVARSTLEAAHADEVRLELEQLGLSSTRSEVLAARIAEALGEATIAAIERPRPADE